jgi:23S rRNA pseudouridine2605 synthase
MWIRPITFKLPSNEGRNRHIRRMFETIDVEILRLMRVAIGALKLGDLPKGEVRALSEQEKAIVV